ncbi:hypothetical protein [Lewinella sp. IMCC34183]|uniref:hypothetical protein n=1 Tax=Lewinella sp. IMCC34183 TaxID=2248762 RepID=UPI000E260C80|nr:hypothetical protein [Lewinella sp. IMCC34183]
MKFFLFTLLSVFSFSAFASIDPADLLVQADPMNHSVTLRTTTSVPAASTLQIVDDLGRVLHTARLDSGEYLNLRFQLSALPTGKYNVVLKDEIGETVQPLLVDRAGIIADPALASRTFYPRVDLKESMLTINYLNTDGKNVNIRISDKTGTQLISDKVANQPTIQKAYNLQNLPAGDYYVTVNRSDAPAYHTTLRLQ